MVTDREAACTLARAGWPQDLIPTMVTIGRAESGLDPAAVNADASVASAPPTGWLQIRAFPDRTARWDLRDPVQNAQAGLDVYHTQGLGAWETYPAQAARFSADVQRSLAGFDYSGCGDRAGTGATAGTGLMAGRAVDPWGIGQGITDAVGYTGSTLGGIGRRLEGAGTLLIGVLLLAGGVGLLGWMFLTRTQTGRGIRQAAQKTGKAAGTAVAAVALAPK